jgi:hypothetical protein
LCAQAFASLRVQNATLLAAKETAAAAAERHRAAEMADRARLLAALQGATDQWLGASWDYALLLGSPQFELLAASERRGAELQREESRLTAELAGVNAELTELRAPRSHYTLENRVEFMEGLLNVHCMGPDRVRVKEEPGSPFSE